MAVKQFDIEGVGPVSIHKRKGSRSLRVSISATGAVKVTIPYLVSYAAGLAFARSRADWIASNRPAAATSLAQGSQIGKAHRLKFLTADVSTPSSRISGSEIRILRHPSMVITHPAVQKTADSAAIRALRLQAARLLPGRLQVLAAKHGFTYTSVNIKRMTGRWGSCDNQRRIVLNLYLMQLPWPLIDYVLLHELVHTRHMNHGQDFWDTFIACEPEAKVLRKAIKQERPVLMPVMPAPPV